MGLCSVASVAGFVVVNLGQLGHAAAGGAVGARLVVHEFRVCGSFVGERNAEIAGNIACARDRSGDPLVVRDIQVVSDWCRHDRPPCQLSIPFRYLIITSSHFTSYIEFLKHGFASSSGFTNQSRMTPFTLVE